MSLPPYLSLISVMTAICDKYQEKKLQGQLWTENILTLTTAKKQVSEDGESRTTLLFV